MTRKQTPDTPEDGDYAAWLEQQQGRAARGAPAPGPEPSPDLTPVLDEEGPRKQTVEDVLVHGEEPTDEFLQEWRAADEVPMPSDEDLERQALEAGGQDGDPGTPE